MQTSIGTVSLFRDCSKNSAVIYRLTSDSFLNRYFIISTPDTTRLMRSPEVVGYDSYQSMVPATEAMLRYFQEKDTLGEDRQVNILTILRGGLNYPIEECCHHLGIQVNNINFLSCERIFKGSVITGLDIKYEKLAIVKNTTLLIGDILASGDTMSLCFQHIAKQFADHGGSIRKVVFFTIGGTRSFDLFERLTREIRHYWRDFEGFECIFYEGCFSVATDRGLTGISVPMVDFGWKGGIIAPEFRRRILCDENALFEKCIIYDGGARRYEIHAHYDEVIDYWKKLSQVADNFTFHDFLADKLGHPIPITFPEWLRINRYEMLDREEMEELFQLEEAFTDRNSTRSVHEIAAVRIAEFDKAIHRYART